MLNPLELRTLRIANLQVASEGRQINQIQRCETCDQPFTVHRKRPRRFCGRQCCYAKMKGEHAANAGGGQHMVGANNPNWKDGRCRSRQAERIELAADHKQWRRRIFERDHYTCQRCGDDQGKNLQAHHIASWHQHPDLRFTLNNGVTLCTPCHRWVHGKQNTEKEWLKDA